MAKAVRGHLVNSQLWLPDGRVQEHNSQNSDVSPMFTATVVEPWNFKKDCFVKEISFSNGTLRNHLQVQSDFGASNSGLADGVKGSPSEQPLHERDKLGKTRQGSQGFGRWICGVLL